LTGQIAQEAAGGEPLTVVTWGGDGTTSIAANAIVRARPHLKADINLVPLPGGRANDFSTWLYGENLDRFTPAEVVTMGTPRMVDTIGVASHGPGPDGELLDARIATSYVGFATARVLTAIDSQAYRGFRTHLSAKAARIADKILTSAVALGVPSFKYEQPDKTARAKEMLFWLVNEIGGNALQTDNEKQTMRLRHLGRWLLPLRYAVADQTEVKKGGLKGVEIAARGFTLRSNTRLHSDGERQSLLKGSHVTIMHFPDSLPVLGKPDPEFT
jgi:hypothetical protein